MVTSLLRRGGVSSPRPWRMRLTAALTLPVKINVPLFLRPFRFGRFALAPSLPLRFPRHRPAMVLSLLSLSRRGMKCLQGSFLADEPTSFSHDKDCIELGRDFHASAGGRVRFRNTYVMPSFIPAYLLIQYSQGPMKESC